MHETYWLQTCAARKAVIRSGGSGNGADAEENEPPASRVPSRNTGQGAGLHGKPKPENGGGEGKPRSRSESEGMRVKARRVMGVRLEASRSILGQDEGGRKPAGGLQGF